MTAHVGTMSVDGTPISQADMARIEAEEKLHARQQRGAVRVVASAATDVDDARTLLAMLGLGPEIVSAARAELTPAGAAPAKRSRKRRAA
ncbi:hypothetical protein [Jatrophihabitans endophyticus]|uniref:hypothetical protein n=1 Tax=Jatrophihabitans endophyticus TaxID=1206085 RepID=UPI0019F3F238|nr:hypothetical protein [Jatrophihabitans endophyticus]MBE7189900.1 hypothetical protein [Jatrophihabitans endophyticus]